MTIKRDDFDPKAYNPEFKRHFLSPKYWGTWLGVILFLPLSLMPLGLQKWLAKTIAKKNCRNPTRGQLTELGLTLSCVFRKSRSKNVKL